MVKQLKEWHKEALELREQGWKSRKIAEKLIGRESAKSSVNFFFKDYDAGKYENIDNGVVNKPKILYYDIENTLAISYHWQVWKTNLGHKQRIQESHLLSHAWAWGDSEVDSSILSVEEVLNHDAERLVLEAWSLVDNCDILIAHNGKRFDVKKLNSWFLQYGLPPPSPYKVIDTLLIAKKKFALEFNSLEYIAKYLGVEQKIATGGMQLWIDCQHGNQEALDSMELYNRGDITTLRSVYKRLQGWDNDGVNFSNYTDHEAVCVNCGSADIKSIDSKFAYTAQRKYSLFKCNSCGANLRGNRQQGKVNTLIKVV